MNDTMSTEQQDIAKGRSYIEFLERAYGFECEAGPLANCVQWHALKLCFEHLAALAAQPQAADTQRLKLIQLEQTLNTQARKLAEAIADRDSWIESHARLYREYHDYRNAQPQAAQEPVKWWNGCNKTVPQALRFLADHERPSGGEERFNALHLHQLADEIDRMANTPLYTHPEPGAQAVPDGWRETFTEAVYNNLAAADNQDIPLEEYPARILSVLDGVVGPRHPTVVKWRNDAIKACIAIAYKYCRDPESFQYLKQDLEAMLAAAQSAPAQPERKPMTHEQILAAIQSVGMEGRGRIVLTYESGPYGIDRPTLLAVRFARAIEAAHGIKGDGL